MVACSTTKGCRVTVLVFIEFSWGLPTCLYILVCHSVTPRSRAVHFHSYERGHPKLPYEVWKVEFIHRLQSYRTCLNLNTSSLVYSTRCTLVHIIQSTTRLTIVALQGEDRRRGAEERTLPPATASSFLIGANFPSLSQSSHGEDKVEEGRGKG